MNPLICPMSHCRAPNDPTATFCRKCGTPLGSYVSVTTHAAQLFNAGLKAARQGNISQARDLFAAVVYWYPHDIEARNALAMAYLAQRNINEAYHQWEIVLEQSPSNPLAQQGKAKLYRFTKKRKLVKKRHRSRTPFKMRSEQGETNKA